VEPLGTPAYLLVFVHLHLSCHYQEKFVLLANKCWEVLAYLIQLWQLSVSAKLDMFGIYYLMLALAKTQYQLFSQMKVVLVVLIP
jgi:hypothetical protein